MAVFVAKKPVDLQQILASLMEYYRIEEILHFIIILLVQSPSPSYNWKIYKNIWKEKMILLLFFSFCAVISGFYE